MDVYQLLVAVTLSAQTTDVSVNKITPALFEKYPTPATMAQADPKDIMKLIRTIECNNSFHRSAHLTMSALCVCHCDVNAHLACRCLSYVVLYQLASLGEVGDHPCLYRGDRRAAVILFNHAAVRRRDAE